MTLSTLRKDVIYAVGVVVLILSAAVHYAADWLPGGWLPIFQAIVGAGTLILGLLGASAPVLAGREASEYDDDYPRHWYSRFGIQSPFPWTAVVVVMVPTIIIIGAIVIGVLVATHRI